MSDISGPNEGHAEVGPEEGPEYLESSSGAPLPGSTSSGKKFGLIAAAAVVGVGVIGAGAWAAAAFFSDGAQPAEALPSTTVAYVSVDMEPSGEQQVEAYRFLKKFPAFNDLDDSGDAREQLFTWIQDQGSCDGVDYADDVEPWLGTSAAVAAVDLGKDKVSPVLVVQVTDADAAQDGLKKLQGCEGDNDTGGWVIDGDWAVVAEDGDVAADVVAAAKEESLENTDAYAKWMDEVGDLGVMTMYVGPEALDKVTAMDEAFGEPGMADLMDQYRDMAKDFTGMAATLRFDGGDVEFVLASDASLDGTKPSGTQAGKSISRLPADTAGALGISVGKDYAKTIVDQLASGGEDTNQMITDLEQQTGLAFPEDLQTLLGEATVLAVGGDINIDRIANSSDGSDIPIGLKITGDAGAIEPVVDKIRQWFGPQGETLLGSDASGDTVAIGPSADYRAQLLDEGTLGESDTFDDVIGDADEASAVLFIDFDAADNWLDQLVADSEDPETVENLKPLRAFGMLAEIDGEVAHVTLRVTTD